MDYSKLAQQYGGTQVGGNPTLRVPSKTEAVTSGISQGFKDFGNALSGVVGGLVAPVTESAVSAARGIQATPDIIRGAFGNQDAMVNAAQTMAKPINLPFIGETTPLAGLTPKQALGRAATTASNLVGARGASRAVSELAEEGVRQATRTGVVQGGASGFLGGFGSKLQDPNATFTQALVQGVGTGVVGAGVGAVAPKLYQKSEQEIFNPVTATKKAVQSLKGVGNPQVKLQTQIASIDSLIDEAIGRGVKPSVKGKGTMAKTKQFNESARDAVKTIVENRASLSLADEDGNPVSLPKNLNQFAQAIDQSKKTIYQRFNQMTQEATGQGIQYDSSDAVAKLKDVTKNLKYNPEVRKYAQGLIDEVQELQGATPDVIEARIADYNQSLQSYYSSGRVDKAKAQVDASVAQLLRQQLDNMIETTSGPGYQQLKKQYGSLKALEADVNKRAVVDARKNEKGFFDLTDIFTGGDIAYGVLTLNPAFIGKGIAQKLGLDFIKKFNDPNRYVKNMFEKVGKVYEQAEKAGIPLREAPEARAISPVDKYTATVEKGKTTTSKAKARSLEYFVPKKKTAVKVTQYDKDFPKYITPDQIEAETDRFVSKKNAGKNIDVKRPRTNIRYEPLAVPKRF